MSPAASPSNFSETRHASAVAIDGRGILIIGASGSGKSTLALELISRGAKLISDDLTRVTPGPEGWPVLSGTGRMIGAIEARGVGILRVPHVASAPLSLVVDLDEAETERLPEPRFAKVLDQEILSLRRVDEPHFHAAIVALIKGGRVT